MDQEVLDAKKKYQEKFFLGLYGINLVSWFINYSMLIQYIPDTAKYLAAFNLLALLMYFLMGFQVDEKLLWIGSFILFFSLVSCFASRDVVIADLGILIFISQGVQRKKILREYVIIASVMVITIFLFSQAGVIQDLIFVRGGVERHAFGSIQPTVLSAQLFSLCAVLACLQYKTIKYFQLVGMIGISFVCYWFLNARNDTAFILMIVVTLLLNKWRVVIRSQWIKKCLILIMPIVSLIVYVLSAVYDSSNGFMRKLNNVLSNRLSLSNIALDRYPIKLFGQKTIENGNGAGTQVASNNYFYIDSSYLRLLLRYGLLLFVLVIGLYVISMIILASKREFVIFVVLAIMSVQVMWEQSFLSVGNVLIFYVLMDAIDYKNMILIIKSRTRNFLNFMKE